MEQPGFRNYDRDQSLPSEGGRISRSYVPEFSRLAGHFLSVEKAGDKKPVMPLRGVAKTAVKAALGSSEQNEKPKPEHIQYSAWHRIETDADGNAKSLAEQGYGQAMQLEVSSEHGTLGAQSTASSQHHGAAAAAVVHTTVQPPVQGSDGTDVADDTVAAQTNSNTMQSPRTPAPYGSFSRPYLPVKPDRTLSAGPLTQDPEHMLEEPHPSVVGRIVKSPWVWLGIGLALIIYFL